MISCGLCNALRRLLGWNCRTERFAVVKDEQGRLPVLHSVVCDERVICLNGCRAVGSTAARVAEAAVREPEIRDSINNGPAVFDEAGVGLAVDAKSREGYKHLRSTFGINVTEAPVIAVALLPF